MQGKNGALGVGGGELQHHGQVIGQFACGVDQQPRLAIDGLDRGQHLAAPPGVAVGPVAQVQGVPAR